MRQLAKPRRETRARLTTCCVCIHFSPFFPSFSAFVVCSLLISFPFRCPLCLLPLVSSVDLVRASCVILGYFFKLRFQVYFESVFLYLILLYPFCILATTEYTPFGCGYNSCLCMPLDGVTFYYTVYGLMRGSKTTTDHSS